MISVTVENDFDTWRDTARSLLAADIPPHEVLWQREQGLFPPENSLPPVRKIGRVPKDFLALCRVLAHHRSHQKWSLLYRALYRLTNLEEKTLLSRPADPDVALLNRMKKEISRDLHKMHAFVRFQKVGTCQSSGLEQFVSWYEPDHEIMPLGAPFFQKRFTGMIWSIFTPTGTAHWDGETLHFAEGVSGIVSPGDDELESLWKTYYRSIFNPARIKVKAMQAEMPKKFWKNLPEAELISELIASGDPRVAKMMTEEGRPARPIKNRYLDSLKNHPDSPSEP